MNNKVVILYHRQPYEETYIDGKAQFNQLSKPNGIIPILKNLLGSITNGTWVCASLIAHFPDVPEYQEVKTQENRNILLKRVPLSKDELHTFYHLSSKEGFWPILHSFPEKYNSEVIDWQNFVSINKRFADAVISEAEEGATIWIQDYNLWLVPAFIREKVVDAKIAFFLHTPFPGPDIFNMLHWRYEILNSLLCCDLIGFNIPRYVQNFVASAKSCFDIEIAKKQEVTKPFYSSNTALNEVEITKAIVFKGRDIKLEAVPIGLDITLIEKTLKENYKKIEEIRASKEGRKLIFSVSRLDYIKGTSELLEAYSRLLSRRPDLKNKISLCIVAVEPAKGMNAYDVVQVKIRKLVDEINLRFSNDNWIPVIFSEKPFSFEDMISWFVNTDIMCIPSLRDGLNMVCKEYIAAKQGDAGVLILSEFAGVALEFPEAILINPYSNQSMDQAFDRALTIPICEQCDYNLKMYEKVLDSNGRQWASQLAILGPISLQIDSREPLGQE
jgi:glucosylglycerol-phosphate synthase